MRRLGAVVIFREGTTREQAEAALRTLEELDQAEGSGVEDFDPEAEGWPVWYIP